MDSKNEPAKAILESAAEDPSHNQAPRRFWHKVALMIVVGLAPVGAWLVGSGIVLATPPVYCSGAMIRVDSPPHDRGAIRREAAKLKSDPVIEQAARALTRHGGKPRDPMAEYVLWSSLTVKEHAGPNLIKVVARGSEPEEARRLVMAVVQAYEQIHAEPLDRQRLIYLDPLEAGPARVADETRMMLGVAGLATIGLLLCIPLLRRLEQAMPLRPAASSTGIFPQPTAV